MAADGQPQRTLPLRVGTQVQALSRRALTGAPDAPARSARPVRGEGAGTDRRFIRSHAGLRGIAALLVVAYHLQFTPMPRLAVEKAGVFFWRGYVWVDLFFILSGFVMMLTYGERFASGVRRRHFVDFLAARLARLYPLHILTLGYLVALAGLALALRRLLGHGPLVMSFEGQASHVLPLHVGLLQVWSQPAAERWNNPSWSISAEAHVYLLLPFIAWAMHCRRGVTPIAMLIVALLLYATIGWSIGTLNIVWGLALARCLAGFGLGVLAYAARRFTAHVPTMLLSVLQVVALASALTVQGGAGPDLLVIPAFLLLVWSTWEDRGLLARLAGLRPARALGDWSYGIYLLHTPLIVTLSVPWFYLLRHGPPLAPDAARLIYLALVAITLIPLSWLVFERWEKPARRWSLAVLTGRRAGPIRQAPGLP